MSAMACTCPSACCAIAALKPSMTGPRSAPYCHGPSRLDASTGGGPRATGAGGGGAGTAASVDASSA
eukprot:6830303-Lingulodinium_polyedra.AAC.1